ncbi:glycosyltransferase [Deinococcus detaillensis]|uniref:Glycosyltransferase n=1 Tax=Deinococcus detaillensis TaxID=2592048 RepID=A0A553V3T2_9DEIO|nr:glycosyltransferase [Deinococcus detaillensis]TSA87153.1 glycosyltransferase [Deinococcus detaillensis]
MTPPLPETQLPVFYDPKGVRRRRLHWTAAALGGLLLLASAGMVTALWQPTELPGLKLANHLSSTRPWMGVGSGKAATNQPTFDQLAALPAATATAQATPTNVTGFYVAWDDNSFSSLKRNLPALDVLVPEWWHLGAGGHLLSESPSKNAAMLDYLRSKPRRLRSDFKVMALINNYDPVKQDWASARLGQVLASPAQRSQLIQELMAGVAQNHFGGLNIDFENLPDSAQHNYAGFIAELASQLHAVHAQLTLDAPLDDPAFEYVALGKLADHVILMAYDEHEEQSEAGPIASQGWLRSNVASRLKDIPASKLTVALGSYGYDWAVDAAGRHQAASELTFQEALSQAKDAGVKPHLDAGSLNPTYTYADDTGRPHHVWYLNGVSAYDQAQAVRGLGISSLAMWRLGSEDPSVWPALRLGGAAAVSALSTLQSGYDIDYEGQGELLKVSAAPSAGQRLLHLDPVSQLITRESVSDFASPYVIQRWGAADPKKIALTFDDGPDAVYTPQLLDILKRQHVPGTFFVIGLNAQTQPDLLRRMVAEGDEIGSHTFTHPNLALVSRRQFDLELNATQRLIEGEVGIRTLLFRPPFAEDVEPETPDEAALVARASQLGYYTVGMQIDPGDWEKPGVANIVKNVLAQAQNGNVVLLHDAGGNREQTVQALPRIIAGLRARGYSFTTVSALAGLTTAQVNPPISSAERLTARLMGLNFEALGWAGLMLSWLFKIGITLSVARLLLIAGLALREAWSKRTATPDSDAPLPSVTVIVPAYNEAKVINASIASLLASDLPNLQIYMVDDGSTDGTFEAAQAVYGQHPRVTLRRITNGGKARALNYAIARVDTEVVLLLDADTQINKEAARLLARHFADPAVAAVAGNAKVGNRVNLLTRWQALEYITAQNLERRALAQLNAISVVPGAIGAWRREVLLSLGSFDHDTLAEDADLTMRALRAGYKVTYELGAVARTEAPDTLQGFLRQRDRWMFGTLQATWKQRGVWKSGAAHSRSPSRGLGLFTLPNVMLFQVFFPLVGALLDVSFAASLIWALLQLHYHPDGGFSLTGPALAFYLLFVLIDVLAAALAFALEPEENWRLLPLLIPQRIIYRQLMSYVAIRAVLSAAAGQQRGWGKLERKASVVAAGD